MNVRTKMIRKELKRITFYLLSSWKKFAASIRFNFSYVANVIDVWGTIKTRDGPKPRQSATTPSVRMSPAKPRRKPVYVFMRIWNQERDWDKWSTTFSHDRNEAKLQISTKLMQQVLCVHLPGQCVTFAFQKWQSFSMISRMLWYEQMWWKRTRYPILTICMLQLQTRCGQQRESYS